MCIFILTAFAWLQALVKRTACPTCPSLEGVQLDQGLILQGLATWKEKRPPLGACLPKGFKPGTWQPKGFKPKDRHLDMLFELYDDCVAFLWRMWPVAAGEEGAAAGGEDEGAVGGEDEGAPGGEDAGEIADTGATGPDAQRGPPSRRIAFSDRVADMVDEETPSGEGGSVMGESGQDGGGDEATGLQHASPGPSSPMQGP